jgi:hypothetical protein
VRSFLERTTWSEAQPEGRWHVFSYKELIARDKANLDIFWLRDESLEDSANLPAPEILAQEIADTWKPPWNRSRACLVAWKRSSRFSVPMVEKSYKIRAFILGRSFAFQFAYRASRGQDGCACAASTFR